MNSTGKNVRLRSAADFRHVYEQGAKRRSNSFALFVLPNGRGCSRFGVTTTRKLGKAHERNRVRRRIREILRMSWAQIPSGFDFVVNPRRTALDRNFEELRRELLVLLGVKL